MQPNWFERQSERAVVRPRVNAKGVADNVVDLSVLCVKLVKVKKIDAEVAGKESME